MKTSSVSFTSKVRASRVPSIQILQTCTGDNSAKAMSAFPYLTQVQGVSDLECWDQSSRVSEPCCSPTALANILLPCFLSDNNRLNVSYNMNISLVELSDSEVLFISSGAMGSFSLSVASTTGTVAVADSVLSFQLVNLFCKSNRRTSFE